MLARLVVIFGVLFVVVLWRDQPATATAPRPRPAAELSDVTSLVVDPFAEVGCRGTGESSLLCDQPECDCTRPIGMDPCFADGCECFCAMQLENMGFYAPPR